MTEAPGPGLYRDVPYETYAAWPGVRASALIYMEKSPAHVRRAERDIAAKTEALIVGNALHTAVLEPDLFDARYIIVPDDAPAKPGKNLRNAKKPSADTVARIEWWDAFEERAGSRAVLSVAGAAAVKDMAIAARAHPWVAAVLAAPGVNELSIVWIDEETQLTCKARIDRLASIDGRTVIVDLKTCEDASQDAFARSVLNYGYHWRMAWYRAGLAALVPAERDCTLVAIEKDRPAPEFVAIWPLADGALKQGHEEMAKFLRRYAECKRTGRWTGYGDGGALDLPRHAQRKEFRE
ncbi:MAG: PD-(D/E)XK nuclease-like domain-containing protein [Acidobacteria bacterium]|nr:PD-(D/E)XK nuclease-like domain-containing protein [Acidobacteriota bacterium]